MSGKEGSGEEVDGVLFAGDPGGVTGLETELGLRVRNKFITAQHAKDHTAAVAHAKLTQRYEALELALDMLGDVDEEMQSQFSPALSRETAAIWKKLTGGRYSTVALSRELTATVGREGDTVPHEGSFLSRGANDQLYLSLRLALCERLLPEKERCPIVLDDALINFDDERMKYALDYLRELSETRQILLFTCHGREKEYIESLKAE